MLNKGNIIAGFLLLMLFSCNAAAAVLLLIAAKIFNFNINHIIVAIIAVNVLTIVSWLTLSVVEKIRGKNFTGLSTPDDKTKPVKVNHEKERP